MSSKEQLKQYIQWIENRLSVNKMTILLRNIIFLPENEDESLTATLDGATIASVTRVCSFYGDFCNSVSENIFESIRNLSLHNKIVLHNSYN